MIAQQQLEKLSRIIFVKKGKSDILKNKKTNKLETPIQRAALTTVYTISFQD